MRVAGHLDIGPLRFALRLGAPGTVRYSAPAHGGFFSAGAGPARAAPLCELPVDLAVRSEPVPAREPLRRGGKNWAIWEDGGDLVCHAGLHARERAGAGCRVARDLSRAELALASAPADGVFESPLRYPLDQILSWGLLGRIGGALLHAAAGVKDGTAWVFAGRSGAGKSTLSALCRAEGFRILNDDRVLVFRRAGEWKVAGTPWPGSGRFAEAAEAPLGGIFFLRQAGQEALEALPKSQVRLSLLDVAAVPWFEDSWAQGTLDGLERLTQGVECRRFHFTKTPAAAKALAALQGRGAEACA